MFSISKHKNLVAWFFIFLLISLGFLAKNYIIDAKEPITIALVSADVDAAAFEIIEAGVEVIVDEVNDKGGIRGRKIVVDIYDDRDTPEGAAIAARKVISEDEAIAVIGHTYSSTSIAAGPIYDEHGIPVISPAATNPLVTKNSPFSFRTVYDDTNQAKQLSNYVYYAFAPDLTTIISHDLKYGMHLAEIIEQQNRTLGIQTNKRVQYSSNKENLIAEMRKVADEVIKMKDPGVIYFAGLLEEAGLFVKHIRDAGLDNIIVGPDTIASPNFIEYFNAFPKKIAEPGYYTKNIYFSSPLLFDTANEQAKWLSDEFPKYSEQPIDWMAAYSAECLHLIVEGLKKIDSKFTSDSLIEDRKRLRDFLASLKDEKSAIEGYTGLNYFDDEGTPPKPITMGFFKDGQLISAPTQITEINNPENFPHFDELKEEGRITSINGSYFNSTNIVYTGIEIKEIKDLSLSDNTVFLDFEIWFRSKKGIPVEHIVFENQVSEIKLEEPLEHVVSGDVEYSRYRVSGTFKNNFIAPNSFAECVIGFQFHHAEEDRDQLLYVLDTLGMTGILDSDVYRKELKVKSMQALSKWRIERLSFFQGTTNQKKLGNPYYLDGKNKIRSFSSFNTIIRIKENALTIRRSFSANIASYLLFLIVLMLFIYYIEGHYKFFQNLPRTIWFLQAILAFIVLLSAEIILIKSLIGKIDSHFLPNLVTCFDISWWLVVGFFVNSGIKRFIYRRVEIKSDQAIPDIIYLSTSIFVFLLSVSGIISFVFDMRLTGILTTSGVAAAIIGLALQVNLNNIFSGIALNIQRPFEIGDWVKIGDYPEGKVIDVNWRATKIETFDECFMSIPNASVSESTIHNFHAPDDVYWLWPKVQIAPHIPPERVKKIIKDACFAVPDVLREPAPEVYVNIAEWSVDYCFAFAVRNYESKWEVESAVWERVWYHLHCAGIELGTKSHEIYNFEGRKEEISYKSDPIAVIKSVEIFTPFSDEQCREIAEKVTKIKHDKNSTIFKQGDSGDSLFIILEGSVSINVSLPDGKELEVSRLGAGEFVGEMALLTGENRAATVKAITNSELLEISRSDIRPYIQGQDEIAKKLSEILADRKLYTKIKVASSQEDGKAKTALIGQLFDGIKKFFSEKITQSPFN